MNAERSRGFALHFRKLVFSSWRDLATQWRDFSRLLQYIDVITRCCDDDVILNQTKLSAKMVCNATPAFHGKGSLVLHGL